MKVSVVIRTFDSERTIGEVLEAVSSQGFTSREAVIVDSGSTDATPEIIGRYPHTLVDFSKEPFGYGAALNAGISAAKGEYVACLSSHCVPLRDDWLDALVGAMEADESLAGAWGPLVFERRDGLAPERGVDAMDLEGFYREPNRGLQNSNSIIRRSLWEERPFSGEVPTAEDQEWAHHFLSLGYRTALVRGAPALYRIPHGPFRYGRKMSREFLVLNDMFGYESGVTIFSLLRRLMRLILAVVLGRRSPWTSVKVFAGMVGTWHAARVVRRKRKRHERKETS
jgi:glycosyltransferase involved in cell wall biosynthesis